MELYYESDIEDTGDFPTVIHQSFKGLEVIERRCNLKKTTDNRERAVNWDALVSSSPVLEAWMRWEPELKTSSVPTLSSFSNNEYAIKQLTDYMQGCRITVTESDVYDLLNLADMLQVMDVVNYCKYRIKSICPSKENYHCIIKACSLYAFDHKEMDQFIRGNLTELYYNSDFLDISPVSVELLLSDEELSYWPMDDKFVFITDWCNVCKDRAVFFEKWFDFIDLAKIDRGIVEVVVKNDTLVRMSTKSLSKVNEYLCCKEQKPIPFVFILNDQRTGSNVTGFNLEDKQLYKFRFPNEIVNEFELRTVFNLRQKLISFDESTRMLFMYDINTNECKKKHVSVQGQFPNNCRYILDASDGPLFIFNSGTFYLGKRKKVSVLYKIRSEHETKIELSPLLSLNFEVSSACISQYLIILSPTTYSIRSTLYFFDIRTNRLTETKLESGSFGFHVLVQDLLPVYDNLLVLSNCDITVLPLKKDKCNVEAKDQLSSQKKYLMKSEEKYIFFSNVIIGLNNKHIRLCYTSKQDTDFDSWQSYKLDKLKCNYDTHVSYAYVNRTKPVCHMMCPHCDPYAWKKEEDEKEQERKRQESLRIFQDHLYFNNEDNCYDDYSDYGNYDDYNDDYNDDPEMFWDASADEFVEAWW